MLNRITCRATILFFSNTFHTANSANKKQKSHSCRAGAVIAHSRFLLGRVTITNSPTLWSHKNYITDKNAHGQTSHIMYRNKNNICSNCVYVLLFHAIVIDLRDDAPATYNFFFCHVILCLYAVIFRSSRLTIHKSPTMCVMPSQIGCASCHGTQT